MDYPGKIDRNMRGLLAVFVYDLKINTYASCGGHTKLSGRLNPVPKGAFYISFFLPPKPPADIISIIESAINVYHGKVVLEKDPEEESFLPLKDGSCSWTINGKGVRPDDFAAALYCKCKHTNIQNALLQDQPK